MNRVCRSLVTGAATLSLVAVSSAAVGSTAAPAQSPTTDGWLALSMLVPSGSAALGSASAAAVQPDVPPPSPAAADYRGPSMPPIPVLIVWAAVLGTLIYIATKNNHSHPAPNSPA